MPTLHTDTAVRPAHGQQHSPRFSRTRRTVLWVPGALLALALLALAGTALLDARDQRRPPPGELIELPDGRRLHLQIAGVEHGGPTIVLEAGQGLFSPAFAWIQDALAEYATVVAYDRPGYGWSTPADGPTSATATVDDLYEALKTGTLEGPYLVVGHSLGAFYARTFAARHPEETLGLVLLDPAHEEQWQRLPEEAVAEFEEAGQMFRWAARMARLGVFRLSNPQRMATVDLPEAAARQIVDITATARYWQTAGAEVEAYDTLAAAPPHGFGDLPVMVISAGRDVPDRPQTRAATDDLHRELVSRSPRATHHVIEEAEHLTLLTVDGHARVVSDLIATLLPPDRRPDQ